MLVTVINVIVMLNLLISILGDSFESFQSESQEIDCLDMADLIIEIETLMYWKRNLNQKAYIQKCLLLEVEGTNAWEGRIKAISMEIKKLGSSTGRKLDQILEQNALILQKLDKK